MFSKRNFLAIMVLWFLLAGGLFAPVLSAETTHYGLDTHSGQMTAGIRASDAPMGAKRLPSDSQELNISPSYSVSGSKPGPVIDGDISVLIVAADDCPPTAELMATGRFSVVDFFNSGNATPSLVTLSAYDSVLAYTNYSPSDAVALGDVLADYVDGGGTVCIATYAYSSGWSIMGRIMTPGYSPLINVGINADVSGALVAATADPIFDDIDLPGVSYFHNWNFAHTQVDAGATLLATDGYGINMIAVNVNRNVFGFNLFPCDCSGGNNGEFYNLLANSLALLIPDDLRVSPSTGWKSSGYEGGPFAPVSQEYVLTNNGIMELSWQATTDAGWVTITPESGVLLPGESLPVLVALNGQADTLAPGDYVADVEFVNLDSSMVFPRPVSLQVKAIPGDCQVQDSISPEDDRQMPFGEIIVGLERREEVTIRNDDPTYSLLMEDISLGASYNENFNDGQAQDWSEDLDTNWEVVEGQYRAQSSTVDWMFSRYIGKEWEDLSASVTIQRQGSPYTSQAVLLRCSSDFDEGIGSGYVFQIATSGDFGIWKQVNGSWSWLVSWTYSSAINPGSNVLMASAQGTQLQFFINGILVWSGTDTSIASGHIGLSGYTQPDYLTAHFFDDVAVSDPITTSLLVSPEQQWYNEHPLKGGDLGVAPKGKASAYLGISSSKPAVISAPRLSGDAFRLENLPSLPFVLGPGQSLVVDVVFAPDVYEACEDVLKIISNDADEPEIQVNLSGVGLKDPLAVDCAGGMLFNGHEGGPFVPTEYSMSMTNEGEQSIAWSMAGPDWVSLSQYAGSLNPGQTVEITVGLTELAATLPVGDYNDALHITDHSTGLVQECQVTLHVYQSSKVWVDPESLDIVVSQGGQYISSFIIGNDGDGDLNFTLSSREIPVSLAAKTVVTECAPTSSQGLAWEYCFTAPELKTANGYQEVSMAGLEKYVRIGAPILPLRPVQLLIPAGKKVSQVRVVPVGDILTIDCKYPLAPGQKPYPLNQPQKVQKTLPNSQIYAMQTAWPNKYLTDWTCQTKRGYQYLITGILPVQYIPAQGKLLFAERVRLEVDLVPSNSPVQVHATPIQKRQIKASVDNPQALLSYPLKNTKAAPLADVGTLPEGGPYHYVVITTPDLAAASGPWNFQALCDARTASGLPATIVTTEYIYANYSGTRPDGGSDDQTRIWNFVMDAYQTWGTQYVLLGGDYTLVPPRQFYVDGTLMPADMYFGCVDPAACTFDNNANGYYGEPWDGIGGGEVDLMAEVYVGRAPVANTTEVANFVSKTLWYNQCTDETFLGRIAMLGEYLGFGGVSEYATASMEQIRLGGCYDSYCTVGFEDTPLDTLDFVTEGCLNPPPDDDFWPLYDSPTFSWPAQYLINLMNGGVHVFNHLGHANETYCMKMYNSDITSLVNDEYFFAYSQGCYSGCFDYPNCFAETLVTNPHGAFATIMNARYGYGRYDSTDGPSNRFDRQFWDAALGEGLFEYGVANQDSKEDNLYDLGGECIRWCLYELNLFGDPAQVFKCSTGCPWLSLDPTSGTVPPGDQVIIYVTADAAALELGQYQAEINVVSNDPEVPLVVIPVDLTVRLEPLQVLPEEPLVIQGVRGGPFEPGTGYYHLTNMDTAPLNWEATSSESWFAFQDTSGTLNPGESVDVQCVVTEEACALPNGVHYCELVFRNTDSQAHFEREVILTVTPPDYYTELFSANDNDMDNTTFVFTPDGSGNFYKMCRFAADGLPTNPAGGVILTLANDDYKKVVLNDGAQVSIYGTVYNNFYVGSNGYITFGTGDVAYGESLSQHFKYKRVSALFDDLSPNVSGQVSWKQTEDRVAVTYWNVPELRKTNLNSFQVELFYDGAISITYLQMDATDGLVGLSRGSNTPSDFAESDYTGYHGCMSGDGYPPDGAVDVADMALLAEHWLAEDCCAGNLHCQLMDVNGDGVVNLLDFTLMAENWLK